eukprot:g23277.t1
MDVPDQRIIDRLACYRNDKRDKEQVLSIIKNNGWAIRYAPPLFRNSEEVCVAAMKTYGLGLEFLSPLMRRNEKVVKAALSHCGMALIFAPEELRSRRDVVKHALQMPGTRVKKDHSLVYQAIQQDPRALQCADDSLKCDRKFLLKARGQSAHPKPLPPAAAGPAVRFCWKSAAFFGGSRSRAHPNGLRALVRAVRVRQVESRQIRCRAGK